MPKWEALGPCGLLALLFPEWLHHCSLPWEYTYISARAVPCFSNWQALSNLYSKWSACSCLHDSLLLSTVIMNRSKPSVIIRICLSPRSMALTRSRDECHIKMSLGVYMYIQIRWHNTISNWQVHKICSVRIFTIVFNVNQSRLITCKLLKQFTWINFIHCSSIWNLGIFRLLIRQVNPEFNMNYVFLYQFKSVFPKSFKELKSTKNLYVFLALRDFCSYVLRIIKTNFLW